MSLLTNKIVLITRSRNDSPEEIGLLEAEGADVIALPTIKIQPVEDNTLIDNAIIDLPAFDYIVFSSKYSVKYFIERVKVLNTSIPDKIKLICVGSKTYEYAVNNNLKISLVPDDFSARGILEKLSGEDLTGRKVLLPSSAISRDELSKGLTGMGASVTFIAVYTSVIPDKDEIAAELSKVTDKTPDIFVFTSPSSFKNFNNLLSLSSPSDYYNNRIIAAIGTTTEVEILKSISHVEIVPDTFTVEACVKEVINFYKTVPSE